MNHPESISAESTIELRDVLAGHIITGLLTAPARPGVPLLTRDEMAKEAYRIADTMVKARKA